MVNQEQKRGEKCCEKCYDVYFEKDYPMHTAIESCTNLVCPCHNKPSPSQQEEKLREIVYRNWKLGDEVSLFTEIKELIALQEKTLREELGKGKLEEAIEKCEELPYFELSKSPDSKWCGITKNVTEYGSTPLEAVQNLLLAIKGEK
tara:strand:- start:281 stop:721 length:441 start_codon:yes stop_codon:yes gene_type:complete